MDCQGLKQRSSKMQHQIVDPPGGKGADRGHPSGPVKVSIVEQYIRAFGLLLFFFVSCLCIFVTQLVGAPLYFFQRHWYYTWMAVTKQHFFMLILTVTQWFSPTPIRVTGSKEVQGQMRENPEGGYVECRFPERMIVISNHQIYTEWIYLWWVAYASQMHGYIYIIMKESLKYIPILGQGMMFFSFVFLSRHWDTDQPVMAHRLHKLRTKWTNRTDLKKNLLDPMWLLIFPEGTNLSANQRGKSEVWAEKTNQKPMRHCLIPRSTGLKFCIDELGDTVDWIYDCTIAYEGVAANQYAQDIYTIRSVFLQGRPPRAIDMYWRRFAVKDISHSDPKEFETWLHDRWVEKDDLLEYYHQYGHWPADDDDSPRVTRSSAKRSTANEPKANVGKVVKGIVRPRTSTEFLQMYAPIATLFNVVWMGKRFFERFS